MAVPITTEMLAGMVLMRDLPSLLAKDLTTRLILNIRDFGRSLGRLHRDGVAIDGELSCSIAFFGL